MTQTIVIAEMSNNTVHASTAELVTAAQTFGDNPVVVVPCTNPEHASGAADMGAGSIIAAKSQAFTHYDAKGWAEALDAVVPKEPSSLEPAHNPKTSLLGSPLAVTLPWSRMLSPSMATPLPLQFTPEKPCKPFQPRDLPSSRCARMSSPLQQGGHRGIGC